MLPAPLPDNEPERLASLTAMQLLSSPDELAFDRVTRTAQLLFDVPIALISLIDENRQWFKSCVGLPVRETPRDVSFCGHAILGEALFVIEDARQDERFADNPLVTGAPRVIFYAGRPLKNADGFMIGTLCIIDHEPRVFDARSRQALDDLGNWVEALFACHRLSEVQAQLLDEIDTTRRRQWLDPMLNIWNQEAGRDIIKREGIRAFHQRASLALLLVRVNDYDVMAGQDPSLAGQVMVEFTRLVRSLVRPYDAIARHDRGTLLLILPDRDKAKLDVFADKLQQACELLFVEHGGRLFEVSVTLGMTCNDYSLATPEPAILLQHAEKALQSAGNKRDG